MPGATAPSPQESLAPPSPDEAIAAFNTVQAWVRAGGVPPDGREPTVPGAAIILRLDGVVVGRATAAGPGCLYAATDAALAEARQRLPKRDALQAEQGDDFGRLAISLELAGPLIPFQPATFDDVDARISPGLEGVGARSGSNLELIFPGSMLTWNNTPAESLVAAISKATGDSALAIRTAAHGQPGAIAKARDITYYRFAVTHLAQSSPVRTPIFLHRGGRLVPQSSLETASLRAWADGLAQTLIDRSTGETPGRPAPRTMVRGPYWPATGTFDPARAGLFEQILVARALDRYAQMRGRDTAQGRRARGVAGELLSALGQIPVGKGGPDSSPATGAIWSAALITSDAKVTDWLSPRGEMFLACRDLLDGASDDISSLPAPQRAVVAFALARRAVEGWPGAPMVDRPAVPGDPPDPAPIAARARARKALDSLYADTPPGNLVTQMPWLGWGDQYLSGDAIAAAPALREMREQVYSHMLTLETAGPGNEDLIGGIVFTASRAPDGSPAVPVPTWHTVRPAAFLASALGDPRLTDDGEVMKELSRLLSILRFLRQLTADESSAWMHQNPGGAQWGVRAAPWDQRQLPDATAMTLITVCETLRSLDEIAKRPAAR